MGRTTKFMGRGSLVKRLTSQVGSRTLAESILKKRGDMKRDGELTSKGKKRDNMTAAERAKDRALKASKKSNRTAKDYVYNPNTNSATLKKRS
jgi:hypothetical protein